LVDKDFRRKTEICSFRGVAHNAEESIQARLEWLGILGTPTYSFATHLLSHAEDLFVVAG